MMLMAGMCQLMPQEERTCIKLSGCARVATGFRMQPFQATVCWLESVNTDLRKQICSSVYQVK